MKGYIYTMFAGADPGIGWHQTDPIFGPIPTMGACMPNIRRAVEVNDYIFAISGKIRSLPQFVAGGFQVQEKINALAAYERFPEYRQKITEDGTYRGNIIVDKDGKRNSIDYHKGDLDKRIDNYIIGKNPIVISSQSSIALAREETVEILSDIFQKSGKTSGEIIARWRKMDEDQIDKLLLWMRKVNGQ